MKDVRERHRRARRLSWTALAVAIAVQPPAHAQEHVIAFDIPEQALSMSLLELGRQARISVLAPADLVAGRASPAVRGNLSARAALERLLEGTGLRFEFVQTDAVRIYMSDAAALDEAFRTPDGGDVDRVVVTGSNIRGVAPGSSPVEIYTAEDIARTGAVTTEQFIGKLPQNLGKTSQYAGGATADRNYDGVTSVDLRGLGVGTTLSLLNGRRMALSNSGQSADVSLIPASAIERIEVLTDGASAIYGSDAIGGVINFVLRRDFEGAETRINVSGVTDGGMKQGDASQTFGKGWGSGSAIAAVNYYSASALQRSERHYSAPAGPGTLSPHDRRTSAFASVTQDVGDRLSLSLDAGTGERVVKNTMTALSPANPANASRYRYGSTTAHSFANLGVDYDLGGDFAASFQATYSKVEVDGALYVTFYNRTPPLTNFGDYSTRDQQLDLMAKLDGTLFDLPGGDVRFTVGGGVLEETYAGFSPITIRQSPNELGRRAPYAFVEIFAPIVSQSQNIPFVDRLDLSLAARYSDYQDTSTPRLGREVGDSIDPKIGVLWAPLPSLALRATYGTSFRAPFLTQIDPTSGVRYTGAANIAGSPGAYLAIGGTAVPDIGPESAASWTAGFDYESDALPGFRLKATYYNIDYTDRIGVAPTGGLNLFTAAPLLPDLIYRPPSAAYVEEILRMGPLLSNALGIDMSNPAAAAAALFSRPNFWIYDYRFKNLALSRTDGFDLNVSQAFETPAGDLTLGADITHVLAYKQQGSPAASVRTAIDVPGSPANWRGRGWVGWSKDGLSGSLGVNYVDSYVNPSNPAAPQPVDSWTTVDLNLRYRVGPAGEAGPVFNLSVQNLLDEDPPRLNTGVSSTLVSPIGFDPANANPMGRQVSIGVTYSW